MKARTIASALLTIAAATIAVLGCSRARDGEAQLVTPALSEAEVRDLDIAFYERRVSEDPLGAADRTTLAGLYLRRARESGGFEDYRRAERVLRESLALRSSHNAGSYLLLASALLAQHDFQGALEAARALHAVEPEPAAHRALLAEVLLEIGEYDEAGRLFGELRRSGDQVTVSSRLARWHEITGNLPAARRLLTTAARKAQEASDLPAEQRAWFFLRLGEIESKGGRLAAADSAFRRGLRIAPDDHRIAGAMARLALLRGDWASAIDHGSRAITLELDPATLGAMSDAYAELGDTVRAQEFSRTMAISALEQPGPIHRAWGHFLLDHDRDVGRVLERARSEIRVRRDVYGFDLLGWALYKSGKLEEAREAMQRALARGTQDALLRYHAGMVELALGSHSSAAVLLADALALNPHFHHRHAATARAALESLRRGHSVE